MFRKFTCAAAALALLAPTVGTRAQTPASPTPVGAAVSDLVGLDPAAVRAHFADVPADWPLPPAFQVSAPDGVLSFVSIQDLMTDPALAERLAAWRTRGDPPPPRPYLQCKAFLSRDGGKPGQGALVVLVFRNGRLVSAFEPVFRVADPLPPELHGADVTKVVASLARRPQTSAFLSHPGGLPLEDGLGFLARLTRTALAPSDRLGAACLPPPPPRVIVSKGPRDLWPSASDFQGMALLPFAVSLPFKNRQRVAARRDGAALLAGLRVGEPLGADPQAFAAGHAGVRAYPAGGGDYAVLTIDMGADPGRNLDDSNDAALVGVRSRRIEWISPPATFGPGGALLCLDAHGVPSAPRRGCGGWGHFTP